MVNAHRIIRRRNIKKNGNYNLFEKNKGLQVVQKIGDSRLGTVAPSKPMLLRVKRVVVETGFHPPCNESLQTFQEIVGKRDRMKRFRIHVRLLPWLWQKDDIRLLPQPRSVPEEKTTLIKKGNKNENLPWKVTEDHRL